MNKYVIIDTRVNDIFYLDATNSIKQHRVYQFSKVLRKQAEELLKSKGIDFNQIIQIILTDVTLQLPVEEFNKYIIKGEDE